jgi:Na+/melibiose symporter-like transporter
MGEIAITTKMVLFGLFVLFFYNSVMGLPAVWVGVATASGLLWDALIDPMIGYHSDTSRSRFGRRHPYMLLGALTQGLSFWLIWIPPRNLGMWGLFLWLLMAMLLFRLTSALFRIPYLSLGAELSTDYHERTRIVGVRSFFGLCGSLAAASLSFYLFFPVEIPGLDPKLSYEGYPKMGLAFGLLMTLAAFVAIGGTLRYRFLVPVRETLPPSLRSFWKGFLLAIGSSSFRKIWLSFSLFFVAVVLNGVVSIHFFTWYVKITDNAILGKIHTTFYLSALAGVIFWMMIAKRGEKQRLYILATITTAALMSAAPFLFGEGHPFGTGNPNPLFVTYALAGFFGSALWVLPASMIADVADEDELVSNLRREGLFFGILNFGEKVAAASAVVIGGLLVDLFVRLAPGQVEQTPLTVLRIGLAYGLAPAALLVVAALVVFGYRLNRRQVEAIQTELRSRRPTPDFGEARPVVPRRDDEVPDVG